MTTGTAPPPTAPRAPRVAPTRSQVVSGIVADALISELRRRQAGGEAKGWSRYAGIQNKAVGSGFDVEVEDLLKNAPPLRQTLEAACASDASTKVLAAARAQLVAELDAELRGNQAHVLASLEALLGLSGAGRMALAAGAVPGFGPTGKPARRSSRPPFIPVLLLNLIVGGTLLAGPVLHLWFGTGLPAGDGRSMALSAGAVWALSFTPGWLFVRFLDRRAGSLWDEYVVHLHRLGIDAPGNLPEPPRSSGYHRRWVAGGGLWLVWVRNLYQEKFDAYYGRSVSDFVADGDRPVKTEALFPIFLCTGVLSVGWTAVLYDPAATLGDVADPGVTTVMAYCFVGAYVFFLQMLLRRYFQADLRAGAYVSGYVRTVVALLVVVTLYAALPGETPGRSLIAVAFLVGWFPDVGTRYLFRTASRVLQSAVPSLDVSYPLNRLDGLNVWYETRLLEEGIEDLENLVTAKIVDVLLHTRVPVARLVDWIDQALLLLHLPPEPPKPSRMFARKATRDRAAEQAEKHPRMVLRVCGIRSATCLERALSADRDAAERDALLDYLAEHHLPREQVLAMLEVLRRDHRMRAVREWQKGEA